MFDCADCKHSDKTQKTTHLIYIGFDYTPLVCLKPNAKCGPSAEHFELIES